MRSEIDKTHHKERQKEEQLGVDFARMLASCGGWYMSDESEDWIVLSKYL